jgi:hypothetical protein
VSLRLDVSSILGAAVRFGRDPLASAEKVEIRLALRFGGVV